MKVTIHTFGCKSNQYDSALLREDAIGMGLEVVPPSPDTEVFVINTCTVTGKSDYQARQMIRRFKKMNPLAIVVATGCYAQVYPDDIKRLGVDYVVGNREKDRLWNLIMMKKVESPMVLVSDIRKEENLSSPKGVGTFERTRAYLKIQDGCDAFCSYCIIPYARGKGRSLPFEGVLKGIDGLIEKGFREIVLTGIHIGSYGMDLGYEKGLSTLLKEIERRYRKAGVRFRISSIEPMEIDEGIIDILADGEIFCHHLHIPLQSGSDRILMAMNRPYRGQDFGRLIHRIHDRMPYASIGVDIIAGFPGEGEEDFFDTYNLLRDLPVSYFHVFPFSRRKGTPAYDMPDQVDGRTIKKRCESLRALGRKKRKAFYERNLGREEFLLVEEAQDRETGLMKGYTRNYIPVLLSGKRGIMGREIKVRLEGIWGEKMKGVAEVLDG